MLGHSFYPVLVAPTPSIYGHAHYYGHYRTFYCLLLTLLLIVNSDLILDLTILHGVITKDLILVLVFCRNSLTLLVVIEVLTSTLGLACTRELNGQFLYFTSGPTTRT